MAINCPRSDCTGTATATDDNVLDCDTCFYEKKLITDTSTPKGNPLFR